MQERGGEGGCFVVPRVITELKGIGPSQNSAVETRVQPFVLVHAFLMMMVVRV